MTRDEYLLLFDRYLSGKATPQELEAIMAYQDDFELPDEITEAIEASDKEREDRIQKRLMARVNGKTPQRIINKQWLTAAAALLIAGMAGLFIYQNKQAGTQNAVVKNERIKNDVQPGTNKALLTLANGKQIVLDDIKTGTVVKSKNFIVSKQKNGVVQYVASHSDKNNSAPAEYNTISTPKGGQYLLVLPDGSKVWLNAASTLRFPTVFRGSERLVELDGEGYFEVAKNKHMPFKINFNNQQVEVLGTHFNIKAYRDELTTRTTLLEGSVQITKNNIKRVLVPGQQAISNDGKADFNVIQGDLEEATAWKDGLFLFHNEDIRQVMKQIARWYNVEVSYQGNLANHEYGGRISKSKNLSEILKNLELTGTIHFKTEGRRVTVMD